MYQLGTIIGKWQQMKDKERERKNFWARKRAAERKFSKMSQEERKEFNRKQRSKKQRSKKLKELIEFAKYVRELYEWHMVTYRMFQRAIKFKKWEYGFRNSFEGRTGDNFWTLTKEEDVRIEKPVGYFYHGEYHLWEE